MSASEKIALFGGSFDPVHRGHLAMAESARDEFGLSQVIFLPCFQSPFKEATDATGKQRYEMLSLAIEEKGWNWASVSAYEITRPEPSFSWKTAEYFSRQNPDADLCWILGTDQWDVIEQWARPERLRNLLDFIVVKRDGSRVMNREGWRFREMKFDHPASSTAIRDNLNTNAEYLSRAVLDYCRREKLYFIPEKN